MRVVYTECDFSMYFGCVLDESDKMRQSVQGRWLVGGGLQVLLGLWIRLGFCSFSVPGSCMSHCSCLFLCMVMRQ